MIMLKLLKKIWATRLVWINYPINKLNITLRKVKFDIYPKISGKLLITGGGEIKFGKHVRINSGQKSNPIGGDNRVIFSVYDNAVLTIGDYTGISNSAIVCNKEVVIGKHVKIGGGTKLYDTDFHNLLPEKRRDEFSDIAISKPIKIHDNVFIGAHSIILKGVIIGENSIIAAGSVVTKNVPKNVIWGGNPAKFIREI